MEIIYYVLTCVNIQQNSNQLFDWHLRSQDPSPYEIVRFFNIANFSSFLLLLLADCTYLAEVPHFQPNIDSFNIL